MVPSDPALSVRAADEAAIVRLVHDYCRGVDRLDRELVYSVFHADATEDHGRFLGLSLTYLADALDRAERTWLCSQHVASNIRIDLCGDDTAFVETYFNAAHVVHTRDGKPLMWHLAGRYIDRFERRGDRWGIAHRTVVKDWQDRRPLTDMGGYGFVVQRRDRLDMSYERHEPFPEEAKVREPVAAS